MDFYQWISEKQKKPNAHDFKASNILKMKID